jgi:hypothetical protein
MVVIEKRLESSVILFRCAVLSLSLAVVGATCSAQRSPKESTPTFKLSPVSSNEINIPNFLWKDVPQCDGLGNAYFASVSDDNKTKYILRIPSDGQNAKPFPLPTDLGTTGDWKFYIDKTGTVYALYSRYEDSDTESDHHTLVEISSSGEEIRRVSLQLPKGFDPIAFAVLPNDRSMVHGFVVLPIDMTKYKNDPSSVKAYFYTAWSDTDGRLIHDTGANAKDRKEFDFSSGPQDVAVVEGRPGTFLALAGTSLNTYNSTGLLLHTQTVPKPAKAAYGYGLQYVDGQAIVTFIAPEEAAPDPEEEPNPRPIVTVKPDPNARKVVKNGSVESVWLFTDPEIGMVHGFYKASAPFVGSSVCYLGNYNFLYFTVKNGRPMFVQQHPQ